MAVMKSPRNLAMKTNCHNNDKKSSYNPGTLILLFMNILKIPLYGLSRSHVPIIRSCSSSNPFTPYEQRDRWKQKGKTKSSQKNMKVDKAHTREPWGETEKHGD
jgi:hypothetical protein